MESVEEWIEKKLEEGADKEALKQVMEEKGYDPGMIDEIAGRNESRNNVVESQPGLEQVSEGFESSSSDENQSFDWRWDLAVVILFLVSVVVGVLVSGLLPI